MKKFLGVLVAVMLCITMIVPVASAADIQNMDKIASALEGLELDNLNPADIANILGVDVSNLSSVLEGLKSSGNASDSVDKVLKKLSTDGSSATTAAPAGGSDIMGTITSMLGGFDISSIASGDMLSSITDLFSGIDMSSFDISALTDMISGAFGDSGIDLSSVTGALGDFDISSILGGLGGGTSSGDGNGSSGGGSDIMATIVNALKDGLGSLGLDASVLDGLMDNEVVNFFANLYQGIGGVGDKTETTTGSTTTTTTKKPTTSPKTGDSSAVFAAVGTLCVASAAAFVCLKKKKANED